MTVRYVGDADMKQDRLCLPHGSSPLTLSNSLKGEIFALAMTGLQQCYYSAPP